MVVERSHATHTAVPYRPSSGCWMLQCRQTWKCATIMPPSRGSCRPMCASGTTAIAA